MKSNKLIEKILKARVYDVVKTSSLDFAHLLSKRLNNQIFLKREDLQAVFSFKLRGAFKEMEIVVQTLVVNISVVNKALEENRYFYSDIKKE